MLLPKDEFDDLINSGSVFGAALLPVAIVLVGLILALWTPKSMAAPTFRGAGDNGQPVALVLHQGECVSPKVLAVIAAKINPAFHAGWRKAVLTYGGKDWESCWFLIGGVVYSLDEEGAQFVPIPRSQFRDSTI